MFAVRPQQIQYLNPTWAWCVSPSSWEGGRGMLGGGDVCYTYIHHSDITIVHQPFKKTSNRSIRWWLRPFCCVRRAQGASGVPRFHLWGAWVNHLVINYTPKHYISQHITDLLFTPYCLVSVYHFFVYPHTILKWWSLPRGRRKKGTPTTAICILITYWISGRRKRKIRKKKKGGGGHYWRNQKPIQIQISAGSAWGLLFLFYSSSLTQTLP